MLGSLPTRSAGHPKGVMATPWTAEARSAEDRLLARYARTRDPVLRDRLVAQFLPLSRMVARRFAAGAEAEDDLQQVAAIGLLKAVDRFDPARGARFTSYAVPTMT